MTDLECNRRMSEFGWNVEKPSVRKRTAVNENFLRACARKVHCLTSSLSNPGCGPERTRIFCSEWKPDEGARNPSSESPLSVDFPAGLQSIVRRRLETFRIRCGFLFCSAPSSFALRRTNHPGGHHAVAFDKSLRSESNARRGRRSHSTRGN